MVSGVRLSDGSPTKKPLLVDKRGFFVYPSRRLGISSRRKPCISSTHFACCISSRAARVHNLLRLDEMQSFALMRYTSFGMDDIQRMGADWHRRLGISSRRKPCISSTRFACCISSRAARMYNPLTLICVPYKVY